MYPLTPTSVLPPQGGGRNVPPRQSYPSLDGAQGEGECTLSPPHLRPPPSRGRKKRAAPQDIPLP
jgi:hypothetical protein